MIERYSRPKMSKIWAEQAKYIRWYRVETTALANNPNATSPMLASWHKKTSKIKFSKKDLSEIATIEKEVKHDVVAFTTFLENRAGTSAKYLHFGLTSSDVVDTALSMAISDSLRQILADLDSLMGILKHKIYMYHDTSMIGRTHGQHAELITFGLKLAVWYDELKRSRDRIIAAKEIISVGKLSGPVGTYTGTTPTQEAWTCMYLSLKPVLAATQIIQRDRHAQVITTLALLGSSIEKFATEIRNLQRTEIGEVEEVFGKNQKGSSSMPHKHNPIVCENLCGLARILRGYALTSMENMCQWGERDISNSSVERVIIPDAFQLIDYMIFKFASVVENLVVRTDVMNDNMAKSNDIPNTHKALLYLVKGGMSRQKAYNLVQKAAITTEYSSFWDNIVVLLGNNYDKYFNDWESDTKYIDEIIDRTLNRKEE